MTHGRRIDVEALARVEGEGALHVVIDEDGVQDVALEIYEPPRFFEGLLRGRAHTEPPDITARICGICPVAYQTSAVHAIEAAAGVEVTEPIRELRRLLYTGEWIESHVLHMTLLHAPDFLGLQDAVELAALDRDAVVRGLRLRRLGDEILEVVGGRPVHPVNVRVGGFHRAPRRAEVRGLLAELDWALEAAADHTRWVAGFDFPDLDLDVVLMALHDPDRYAIEDGRIVTSLGHDLDVAEFHDLVVEEHVARSTALHARLRTGEPYLTGPLARFTLNFEQLSGVTRELAREVGLDGPTTNPFRSIIVRGLEVVEALVEARRIVAAYRPPDPAAVAVPAVPSSVGDGASEAPRGLLHHRYALGDDGLISEARIVPPTSQNQLAIEADLFRLVSENLDLDDELLQWRCEQAIRNHDPCISCAAHFLHLEVERA